MVSRAIGVFNNLFVSNFLSDFFFEGGCSDDGRVNDGHFTQNYYENVKNAQILFHVLKYNRSQIDEI